MRCSAGKRGEKGKCPRNSQEKGGAPQERKGRGKCADQIGERKRGSALPEGFAPGKSRPRASPHKGWNKNIQKREVPPKQKNPPERREALAFGG